MTAIAEQPSATTVKSGFAGFVELAEDGRLQPRALPASNRESGARTGARAARPDRAWERQDFATGPRRASPPAHGRRRRDLLLRQLARPGADPVPVREPVRAGARPSEHRS